ncbi:SDR family NAD(P)-dependent oxidoreductase [Aeromonas schubertii]|uniref:SDR family NAD(P)-dependent oxidoreductase n=1 Tax=Aeromonas schubertii TaxID=652 RepID=UPI0038B5842E
MRALVTGCGRRLGFYLCERLLAAGWQVAGSYRTERPELARLREAGAELWQTDFTRLEEVAQLAQAVASGGLDLLVHNASGFENGSPDPTEEAHQFERFFRVHMQAPHLLNRLLGESLARSGRGLIVHITDIYIHAPPPELAAYVATKAGAHALAMSAARELAPGVRVNTIEPGPILFLDEHGEAWRQEVLSRTPLAKEGGLEPIWQALEMVMANDYMTGASLRVDGGRALARL